MGRPFRVYAMSLVERLGLGTLDNLYASMSNNDIVEWMAYDLTQSDKWREAYAANKDLEEQKLYDREEEAKRMIEMFQMFGGG